MVRYKIQVLVHGISSFFIRTVLYALERGVSVSGVVVVVPSVFIKYMQSPCSLRLESRSSTGTSSHRLHSLADLLVDLERFSPEL
jgi:hypothetical protein